MTLSLSSHFWQSRPDPFAFAESKNGTPLSLLPPCTALEENSIRHT